MAIEARLDFKVGRGVKKRSALLRKYFSKPIVFDEINSAKFTKEMVLAVLEHSKDACIYVLLPKSLFE